jgi:hypothetical protein
MLMTHGEYFALKSGGNLTFRGSPIKARIATEYGIFDHVALGVSYTYFRLDVDADNDEWRGTVNYTYRGPLVYVAAFF